MKRISTSIAAIATALSLLVIGIGGGYWWGRSQHPIDGATAQTRRDKDAARGERQALYWYDPMMPDQHFDKPGKSPFMDMQLVPKFAPGAASDCTIRDVKPDGGEARS